MGDRGRRYRAVLRSVFRLAARRAGARFTAFFAADFFAAVFLADILRVIPVLTTMFAAPRVPPAACFFMVVFALAGLAIRDR